MFFPLWNLVFDLLAQKHVLVRSFMIKLADKRSHIKTYYDLWTVINTEEMLKFG